MSLCGKVQMNATLAGKRKSIISDASGELEQMGVQFREVDPFNLWVSPKLSSFLAGLYFVPVT